MNHETDGRRAAFRQLPAMTEFNQKRISSWDDLQDEVLDRSPHGPAGVSNRIFDVPGARMASRGGPRRAPPGPRPLNPAIRAPERTLKSSGTARAETPDEELVGNIPALADQRGRGPLISA